METEYVFMLVNSTINNANKIEVKCSFYHKVVWTSGRKP